MPREGQSVNAGAVLEQKEIPDRLPSLVTTGDVQHGSLFVIGVGSCR